MSLKKRFLDELNQNLNVNWDEMYDNVVKGGVYYPSLLCGLVLSTCYKAEIFPQRVSGTDMSLLQNDLESLTRNEHIDRLRILSIIYRLQAVNIDLDRESPCSSISRLYL